MHKHPGALNGANLVHFVHLIYDRVLLPMMTGFETKTPKNIIAEKNIRYNPIKCLLNINCQYFWKAPSCRIDRWFYGRQLSIYQPSPKFTSSTGGAGRWDQCSMSYGTPQGVIENCIVQKTSNLYKRHFHNIPRDISTYPRTLELRQLWK